LVHEGQPAILRAAAAGLVGWLALLAPVVARAEPSLAAGFGATWLARMPAVRVDALDLDSRRVREGQVANRGGVALLGGYLDSGLALGDRWTVPLFGGGLHLAIGSYDEVVTSDDGSIATLRPWSTFCLDALLPGLGLRAKHRRWMIGGSVRTGISVLAEGGSVVDGASAKPFQGVSATFLLMGQVEGCRRLDPEQRICVEIAPRLYEFGWLNGATVGLRYELGR
jgi:hypothetical protein